MFQQFRDCLWDEDIRRGIALSILVLLREGDVQRGQCVPEAGRQTDIPLLPTGEEMDGCSLPFHHPEAVQEVLLRIQT